MKPYCTTAHVAAATVTRQCADMAEAANGAITGDIGVTNTLMTLT